METRSSMSRSLHINRDLEKLEPYEGKPSCTVLRGEEGSNALDLPDRKSVCHSVVYSAPKFPAMRLWQLPAATTPVRIHFVSFIYSHFTNLRIYQFLITWVSTQ